MMTVVTVSLVVVAAILVVAVRRFLVPLIRRRRYDRHLAALDAARLTRHASRPSEFRSVLDSFAGSTVADPPDPIRREILPAVDPGVGLQDVLDALAGPAPDHDPTDE